MAEHVGPGRSDDSSASGAEPRRSGDLTEAVGGVVFAVFGVPFALWNVWATVVAFRGGSIPLLGWERSGSFGDGVWWMVVATPVGTLAVYVCVFVVSMLVTAVLSLVRRHGRR